MKAILFYDAPCVLCNFTVDKILKYQKTSLKEKLFIAPLQGETAQKRLPIHLRTEPYIGVVLSVKGQNFVGAKAVRKLGAFLRFPISIVAFCMVGFFYYIILLTRYKLGRNQGNHCSFKSESPSQILP